MKQGATVEQAKAELQPLFRDFVQSAPPPFRQGTGAENARRGDVQ